MIFSKKELTLHQTVKPLLRQSYIMKKLTGILCLLLILASCSKSFVKRNIQTLQSFWIQRDRKFVQES